MGDDLGGDGCGGDCGGDRQPSAKCGPISLAKLKLVSHVKSVKSSYSSGFSLLFGFGCRVSTIFMKSSCFFKGGSEVTMFSLSFSTFIFDIC